MEYVLASFTNAGVPQTGLTPTIRIWDVTDTTSQLVVNNAAMTEIGDGGYKYAFTAYDGQRDYYIRCDGGAGLPDSERYTYGGNDSFRKDIADQVWRELLADNKISGSFGEAIQTIISDLGIVKGLSHENMSVDNTVYDADDNLIQARLRIYSNAASVGTNNNIIATYQFDATGDGAGKFSLWKQVRL